LSPKRLDACGLSLKRSIAVAQTSNPCRPNGHLKMSPKRLSPKRLVAQTSIHLAAADSYNSADTIAAIALLMCCKGASEDGFRVLGRLVHG